MPAATRSGSQPAPPLDIGTIDPAPVTHRRHPGCGGGQSGIAGDRARIQNRTDKRRQVDGTDLGITWESRPGEVAVAFGDTFGADWQPPGANGRDWRSSVLGHSTDTHCRMA